jgi:hypothetical protein
LKSHEFDRIRPPEPEGPDAKLTSEYAKQHPEGCSWRLTFCDPTSENVESKMLASTM